MFVLNGNGQSQVKGDYLLGQVPGVNDFLKHVNEIIVLTMDVSNDDHRFSESNYIWFLFCSYDTTLGELGITYRKSWWPLG